MVSCESLVTDRGKCESTRLNPVGCESLTMEKKERQHTVSCESLVTNGSHVMVNSKVMN